MVAPHFKMRPVVIRDAYSRFVLDTITSRVSTFRSELGHYHTAEHIEFGASFSLGFQTL
jgi:hypothetical protein